jgi:hypothetical protein
MSSYIDMRHNLHEHRCTVGSFSIYEARYIPFAILYFHHFPDSDSPVHQGSMHNAGERSESTPMCFSKSLVRYLN